VALLDVKGWLFLENIALFALNIRYSGIFFANDGASLYVWAMPFVWSFAPNGGSFAPKVWPFGPWLGCPDEKGWTKKRGRFGFGLLLELVGLFFAPLRFAPL
jgi:hypothetical protein